MKTAISVPDAVFERATARAQALGMSRSELFSQAAVRYLDELDDASLVRQIDSVVEALGGDDSAEVAVVAGRAVLADGDVDW